MSLPTLNRLANKPTTYSCKALISFFSYIRSIQTYVILDRLKAVGDRELYKLLHWTFVHTNAYFRGLYKHAMWIPASDAAKIAENGWSMCALPLECNLL